MVNSNWPATYSLKAAEVFTSTGIISDGLVHIRDGVIESADQQLRDGYPVFDLGRHRLLPGLIDVHIHGNGGADVMDATPAALSTIASSLPATGVTGFLATTMTAPWDKVLQAAGNIRQTMAEQGDNPEAEILGCYLEGPFFTPANRGAQPAEYFLEPTLERLEQLYNITGPSLTVAALAPELEHALAATEWLTARGVRVAMGHTDATAEQTLACIEAGASQAVHLFNGMRGIHHRQPGCTGACMVDDRVTTELISDGVHLHRDILQLVWKCKGSDRVALITDCIAAGGLQDGEYSLGEVPVTVEQGVARTASGSLAGSTLTLNRAIHNMIELAGVPAIEAVRMASEVPATQLGLDHRLGAIASGRDASLTLVDDEFNVLLTTIKGRPVYRHSSFHSAIPPFHQE